MRGLRTQRQKLSTRVRLPDCTQIKKPDWIKASAPSVLDHVANAAGQPSLNAILITRLERDVLTDAAAQSFAETTWIARRPKQEAA